MTANIGEGNPIRLITETDFLEFVKDLLSIVKEESHKRMGRLLKKWREGQRMKRTWNGYFKGYKDGVNVFLEEFWDRIQREDGWKGPPSQSVST